MLTQLTIQNFGLIDHLTLDFHQKLNIFTGETGAGKSILIDALRLCLGSRPAGPVAREPEKPASVEAVFELSKEFFLANPSFCELTTEEERLLVLHRTFLTDGKTRNKINGTTVTTAQLKETGRYLVDFHGPHDHQLLFSEDSHLAILDRLADFGKASEQYAEEYAAYEKVRRRIAEIAALTESRDREIDMLAHQIKELEQVPLDAAEYNEIQQRYSRANNAERLYESAHSILDLMEDDEHGITSSIARAFGAMKNLNNLDETTAGFAELLSLMQDRSQELASSLSSYLDSLSFEPQEATSLTRMIDLYHTLFRKYGTSIEEVAAFYRQAKERYALLANLEENGAQLKEEAAKREKRLAGLAQKISAVRKETAKSLDRTIENELKELGIPHVRFECQITKTDIGPKGFDTVTFYISPNAGEPLKPLAEIVSSGEAARVMLALKKALTDVDEVPVLIFDEIDAQIGGRLGTITGKKLKELARKREVILITHLPQIASFGDRHFRIYKKVINGRTVTRAEMIDAALRVQELAHMMSGDKESKVAIDHAQDMLERAKK